tara:strand:+ start:2164 stop:2343 length:180 start_codon:yes stop_codon:yes gene_type:complete
MKPINLNSIKQNLIIAYTRRVVTIMECHEAEIYTDSEALILIQKRVKGMQTAIDLLTEE